MSVFDGVVRKGALGGFGLENLGNVSKLNGTVKLAESFTPTELTQRREPIEDEEFDDEEFEDEEFEEEQREPAPQPKFFGDVNENPPKERREPAPQPKFFGDVNENPPNFFENSVPKTSNVSQGIPKQVEFFGKIPKPKPETPLIGNLKEGVNFFDDAFTRDGQKPPLKRGSGFDNFIGTININKLARGKPDSAVPLRGVFADKKRGVDRQFSNRPVDLAQMNRNIGVLPNPVGFNEEASIEAFEQQIATENGNGTAPKRKAGRPKGSLGKKKRQAKKITKKKKKKSELDKARLSLLKERSRLDEGGAPRSGLQEKFASTTDNSFAGFFT